MAHKYNEGELILFAQNCASGASDFINSVCMAEEVSKSDLGRAIDMNLKGSDELLLEVSKRFAKVAEDREIFNVECGEVQSFQNIIEKIVGCCEENDWFETE